MQRLRWAFLTVVLLCAAGAAAAQDFSGSYATQTGAGATLSLVLRQDASGRITGTLTGNTAFQVQAQVRGGQLAGYAVATGGRLYMEGQLQGGSLVLALAEVGPDGQPQVQTAQTVMMTRSAAGQAAAPGAPGAPQGGRLLGNANAAAPQAQGVAPNRPGGQRGAAADPYAGTFTNGTVTIALSRQGQGYGGVATYQGQQYPLQAQMMGDRLSGMYQANGQPMPFQAQVQGDLMVLATNDGTVQLQRTSGGAMGAPGATGPMGGGTPGGAAAGGVAATAMDQQLAQLLTGSPWCYFSYNQTSGTTRSERVIFRPDGTGVQGTNAETYSSGYAGTVAGQSQGGQPFRWRLQNGVLNASQDGVQWEQIPLRVTQNSNGSPIVNAGSKEYARCN